MFELNIILQRLLLPGLCSFVGCLLLSTSDHREYWEDDEPVRGNLISAVFGALICSAGLIASDFWQRDLIQHPDKWGQWKANEPWQWMVWIVPGSIMLFTIAKVFAGPNRYDRLAWPMILTVGAATMWLVMPQSMGYQDKLPMIAPWVVVGVAAIAWNTLAIDQIATTEGARWNTLVVLAQLGSVATIVLDSYALLGEWVLAGIGTTFGASVVALIRGSQTKPFQSWPLSTVMASMSILATASLAASWAHRSSEIQYWLLAIPLCLPTVVGTVDFLIGRNLGPWLRAVLAGVVSSIMVGVVIYVTQANAPKW